MMCVVKRLLAALLLALLLCTVALADGQPEDALVRMEQAFEQYDLDLLMDVFDPALLRAVELGTKMFDMALSPFNTSLTVNDLISFFSPMTDMPTILGMEADDLKPGANDLTWTVISKRQLNDEEAYMKVVVKLEDKLISDPGGETLYFRCRDGKWYISVEGLVLGPEKTVDSTGPQSALDRLLLGLNKLNFKAATKAYDPFLMEMYEDTYTWFSTLLPIGEAGDLINKTLDEISEASQMLSLLAELGGQELNLFPLFYDVRSCQIYGETAEMYVDFYLDGELLSPVGGTRIWFRQVDGKWYISEEGVETIAPKHKVAKTPEDALKKIGEGLETLDIDLITEAFDPKIVNYLYAKQNIENKLIRGATGLDISGVSKILLSLRPMLVSYTNAPVLEYHIVSSAIDDELAVLRVIMTVDGEYLTEPEGDDMYFRLIDDEWVITYPTPEQYLEEKQ